MMIIIIYTYLTYQLLRHYRARAEEAAQDEADTWQKREDPETDLRKLRACHVGEVASKISRQGMDYLASGVGETGFYLDKNSHCVCVCVQLCLVD